MLYRNDYHNNLEDNKLEVVKYKDSFIVSELSTYLPLFSLYNNKPLKNGSFISWLQFPKHMIDVKVKNINLLYALMNLSSSQNVHVVRVRAHDSKVYVIHHHSLFMIENSYDMHMNKPRLLMTLATYDKDAIEDSDFVLLVKKDLSDQPLFISKLLKKYEKDYPVIKVKNIDALIYANMHNIPLDVDCLSILKKILQTEEPVI